ncbi:hypothetical protein SERLA73DRAFT_55034, partial [Serpula lacrymans var. lacrymans S7.3]
GNERRRWHGTYCRNCKFLKNNLAKDGHCEPSQKCVICSIINTGFRKPRPKPGRPEKFGFGMYFSSTSSKQNGMAKPAKGVRALLLCKVAVGRGCKARRSHPRRTRAPKGFNSILGVPGVTPNLNYDELVTYDIAQNTPAYVIIYS